MSEKKEPHFFGGVTEYEDRLSGEAIQSRSYSIFKFYGLGPPDMCHVIKQKARENQILSTYHFVQGVDASSSASIAAYVQSLVYMLEERNKKETKWSISKCIYCCYNAFSRVDIQVSISFPGGVRAHYIDSKGNSNQEISEEMWKETFISSVVRSFIYSVEDINKTENEHEYVVRNLDPLPTPQLEEKFIQYAVDVFPEGSKLGSHSWISKSHIQDNFLTSAILDYFFNTGKSAKALDLFKRAEIVHNIELPYLCAICYLNMDQESEALDCIYNTLKSGPVSVGCMLLQVDYLLKKKQYDLALKVANYAAIYGSSEFTSWERMVNVYFEMGDYVSALTTLNFSIVSSWNPPNYLLRSKSTKEYPAFNSLPKKYTPSKYALNAPKTSQSVYSPASIMSTNFSNVFRQFSTFSKKIISNRAFNILTRMSSKLGWSKLLEYRSCVFVMENEFHLYKKCVRVDSQNLNSVSKTPNTDKSCEPNVKPSPNNNEKHEDSSVHVTPNINKESTEKNKPAVVNSLEQPNHHTTDDQNIYQKNNNEYDTGEGRSNEDEIGKENGDSHNKTGITTNSSPKSPSISKSSHSTNDGPQSGSDSTHENKSIHLSSNEHKHDSNSNLSLKSQHSSSQKETPSVSASDNIRMDIKNKSLISSSINKQDELFKNLDRSSKNKYLDDLNENPENHISPPVNSDDKKNSSNNSSLDKVLLEKKVLCSKILDYTFVTMYSEIKYYSWFKNENLSPLIQNGNNSSLTLEKDSPVDWEIFGDLAQRYGDTESALEAYKNCVTISDTLSSRLKLLQLLVGRKDIQGSLSLIVGIEIFYYTKNIQITYPSIVSKCIFSLIKEHGKSKVFNYLYSMRLPQLEFDLVNRYFEYAEVFGVAGSHA